MPWTMTFDCARPRELAAFWAAALGYVPAPPPEGFATWQIWLETFDVPEDEWDDGATIIHPDGRGPRIGFLKVPEPKVAKNRLHLDLQVAGGRHLPGALRRERIEAEVARLVAFGAAEVERHESDEWLDHVVMADPEGNEFCVV